MSNRLPVIDYALTPAPVTMYPMDRVFRWRAVAIIYLILSFTFFVLGVFGVSFLAAIGTIGAGCIMLWHLFRLARDEVNSSYAVRHLILAILLMPVFFVGIFLVPMLIESDLAKWRRVEMRNRKSTNENSL